MIVYLRLTFGTACVLAPGWAVARALGQRSASAMLAWTLACLFVAWTAVFALHRSLHLAVAILAVLFALGLAARWRRGGPDRDQDVGSALWVWLVGIVLGWFLWQVEGAVTGDGLFHEARVRKLVDLTSLHLRSVDEFKDGGLHPGYAFPLWHGLDALVAWFSGLDPSTVMRHEPSLLAPIAVAVAYEAGVAVFRSRAGGITLAIAQVALFCFAPGGGGSYAQLAQPANAARQILAPAAIALFFTRNYAATAVVFGALALVHSSYALFMLVPLVVLAYREWRAYIAAAVPVVAVLLWLRPLVNETRAHNPSDAERLRGLQQYADQLVISGPHHFRLAPEVLGRTGAIAIAALFLLPLTALAIRRRWGQYVLGGSLLILLLMEVPWLFVHLADAASLSQARRAAGFAPLPFAFAGGLALAARRFVALPVALAAGIALQLAWPGDFGVGLRHGGPALATWVALIGGLLALGAVAVLRPPPAHEHHRLAAAAAALFVLPVVVHGFSHWGPKNPTDPEALSPRLIHSLRTKVPKGSIVIAPVRTSYEVAAVAPVYIVAAPVTHVANTDANDPYRRVDDVHRWIQSNDPAIARRYGATWAIRAGRLYRLPQ